MPVMVSGRVVRGSAARKRVPNSRRTAAAARRSRTARPSGRARATRRARSCARPARERGRLVAPVEERVDVTEHALRAGCPPRTRADENRAGSPWPARSRPAAPRPSTRRGSRRRRTARRRRRSARRARRRSRPSALRRRAATSSHDVGPEPERGQRRRRARSCSAPAGARGRTAGAPRRRMPVAPHRPARSTRAAIVASASVTPVAAAP